MKSVILRKNGGPEVLEIIEVDIPTPGPREVRVRTLATALNHMDLWVRRGIPGMAALPLVPGCDAAGVVDAVGSEVSRFKKGDRVLLYPLSGCDRCGKCKDGQTHLCREFKIPGEHADGTHREFFCAPEKQLINLDARIDFFTAAAFPLAYLTAWHMVVANGEVSRDKTVLVIAASSGIGSAAVQIAKNFGATVIATAGDPEKCEHAKKLGADHVIDHYREKIADQVKVITQKAGVDLIIEHVGEKVWDDCLKSLAWGGRLVTCGATSGPLIKMDLRHIFIKQQRIIGSTMGTIDELRSVHDLVAEQKIKPTVAKIFPFKDIRDAHVYLEKSNHFGKVVLDWS